MDAFTKVVVGQDDSLSQSACLHMANSYLELSQVEGITGVISDFDFVTEFIALNDEVAPLDDLNVRTAIQMAIDKESIAQNI